MSRFWCLCFHCPGFLWHRQMYEALADLELAAFMVWNTLGPSLLTSAARSLSLGGSCQASLGLCLHSYWYILFWVLFILVTLVFFLISIFHWDLTECMAFNLIYWMTEWQSSPYFSHTYTLVNKWMNEWMNVLSLSTWLLILRPLSHFILA